MELTVEFVGPMRRPWPERRRAVTVPEGTSLLTLATTLGYAPDEARHLVFAVNGVKVRGDTAPKTGDRVSVLLMVGGG